MEIGEMDFKLEKEIESFSEKLFKSQVVTIQDILPMLSKEQLKAAASQMNEEQLTILKSELKKAQDAKFESCVQQVKEDQGGAEGPVNPWAVCHAALDKSNLPEGHTGTKDCVKCMSNTIDKDKIMEKSNILDILTSTARGGSARVSENKLDNNMTQDDLVRTAIYLDESNNTIRHQGGPAVDSELAGTKIQDEDSDKTDYEAKLAQHSGMNNESPISENIMEINKLSELSEKEKENMKAGLLAIMDSLMALKLTKSECISKLAAKFKVEESKVADIWEKKEALNKAIEMGALGEYTGEPKKEKEGMEQAENQSEGSDTVEHREKMEKSEESSEEEKKEESIEKSEESEEYEMPKEEAVEEHKRLVDVLESPSKEDDKEEAKKQKEELESMEKSEDSFYYNRAKVASEYYLAKSEDPFMHRSTGQNCFYNVDQYIEEANKAKKEALAKSKWIGEANVEGYKSDIDNLIANGDYCDALKLEQMESIKKSQAELEKTPFIESFSNEDMDAVAKRYGRK
jgi:hypothetical protein